MNILGIVSTLLVLLSFGALLSFEKQTGSARLRPYYLGQKAACRDLLNQCESKYYASIQRIQSSETKQDADKKPLSKKKKSPEIPPFNPSCARLNLFPLLTRGARTESYLYQASLQLLKTCYGKSLFQGNDREVERFFTQFLQAAAQAPELSLEKISFPSPELQRLYYTLLKGTKKRDLAQGIGLAPLADFFKIDPSPGKICLRHAHPDLLAALFCPSKAERLYREIHASCPESMERICIKLQIPLLYLDLFQDISGICKEKETSLLGEDPDTGISLRKKTAIPTHD